MVSWYFSRFRYLDLTRLISWRGWILCLACFQFIEVRDKAIDRSWAVKVPQGKVTVKEVRVKNQEVVFFFKQLFPIKDSEEIRIHRVFPAIVLRWLLYGEARTGSFDFSLSYTQILGINSDVWGEEEEFWMRGDVPVREILLTASLCSCPVEVKQ